MSREDPQMKIRLPADLKDRIEEMSKQAGRSMNAEIVARLEASFARRGGGPAGLWQCFFDLVRLQSQMETSYDIETSYLKEVSDLLRRRADIAGTEGSEAEIATLDERTHMAQSLAARFEEDRANLYRRRESLEDKIGALIEDVLDSSGKESE
jgi:hypothetical protein